ncbi:ATP-binding protein [Natranaeroarchaeum aerophilus]|uniref:histidine kinase n=1 Tax=Natranaeroarchaeum aerophilus TaxID=2917711 RepID=A0AAE3K378_9EURY|nr:ATP-binding protein [Natranaeroarchaeum aerophilus]MCL9812457.1 PAS domain-containing protein [Natranaeroarchaeum aerophilus]
MTEHSIDDVPAALAGGRQYRRRLGDGQRVLSLDDGPAPALDILDQRTSDPDWLDIVHPDDRDAVKAVGSLNPGESVDLRYRLGTDDPVWVRDVAAVPQDHADVLDGILFDVTEDERRHQELKTESHLLDQLFESIPVHLYVKDDDGVHLRVSDHLEKRVEFVGKTDAEIAADSDPRGERGLRDDRQVIESGEPILDQEEYLPGLDQWSLTSKVPWTDENGEVQGIIGVSRDITERKRAEKQLREETDRLEEFADIVAHDIRNPLTAALGRLELAESTGDPAHLDETIDALDQADAIIDDVLTLARHDPDIDPEWVSLQRLCHGAAHSITAPRAKIDFPADREVLADRSQLRRLLENLFTNAVQHGGTEVRIDVELLDEGFAVADDGPGISQEERERVFEESYTTHPDGTGFGLPIVAEIVEAHGWQIHLTSPESGGTRIEITGVERRDADR